MRSKGAIPVLILGIIFAEVIWGTDQLVKSLPGPRVSVQNEGLAGKVLGAETLLPTIPELPPLPAPIEKAQEENTASASVEKKVVKVLLLGDSMVDFLNDFPHLRDLLGSLNADVKWEILNYGVGASNVSYGLYRVNSDYEYLGRHFQSAIDVNPDIVIVESFAYNHGEMPEAEYQRNLKRIFEELGKAGKKIIFLATIAPSKENYAKGAADWGDEYRAKEYEKTRRFMDLAIDVATQMNIPIVDAFHKSLDGDKGGNEKYIYDGDWIHPSPEGAQFIAELLAPAIISQVE